MIAYFLWGYLCITGIASLLVYVACVAAARADRIKQRTASNIIMMVNEPGQDISLKHQQQASKLLSSLVTEHQR